MHSAQDLVGRLRSYHPNADAGLIERAYDFAAKAHNGQMRKSGDPYFIHPTNVASIITELKLDAASVCAGLLHDCVEDTLATVDDLEREFGEEVAFLVDGVTKLSKINFISREDRQAENFRKMVVAMARDIRVLLVKLCDRLDNMRTLEHMKPEAQDRIARETMEIYAPLANRLGIARVKSELEDLAFQYLDPDHYGSLTEKVKKSAPDRERYITDVCKLLSTKLAKQGFAAEVTGRAKHLYSIWRKMQSQQSEFEGVYDVIAFRCVVESVADCYACLGVIHSQWTPVPGRFKDYVALPKPNMYQSLHTTVLGPGGERIEIQIRTHEMHRVAEQGIAAHWKYKERSGGIDPRDAARFGWLRQLMEFQKELKDPAEFLESVKVDLFQDEVYVFTPKGDVRVFPRGSTPIDFAYAIHSEVGHHCSGAKVNGAIVPLRYKLRNGDVVEVTTKPDQAPSKDWLDFVVTGRARSRIRQTLRTEQRDKSYKLGRSLLEKEMHGASLSLSKLTKSDDQLKKLLEEFKVMNLDELCVNIGYGKLATKDVVAFLAPKTEGADSPASVPPSLREGKIESFVRKITGRDNPGIRLNGVDDILVRYTKCCNPLPGDEIVGFISRGRGVTVHRRTCPKAFDADPERRVEITWDAKAKINRPVQVKVTTQNKLGILATIGQTFHEQGININEAQCRAGDDGRATNIFTFLCSDITQLKNVMRRLQKITGVVNVERV
jgi:GTP diphosphokinase / guanosine-3',5'-bis(diphosphate) 3'-diphosphatase